MISRLLDVSILELEELRKTALIQQLADLSNKDREVEHAAGVRFKVLELYGSKGVKLKFSLMIPNRNLNIRFITVNSYGQRSITAAL